MVLNLRRSLTTIAFVSLAGIVLLPNPALADRTMKVKPSDTTKTRSGDAGRVNGNKVDRVNPDSSNYRSGAERESIRTGDRTDPGKVGGAAKGTGTAADLLKGGDTDAAKTDDGSHESPSTKGTDLTGGKVSDEVRGMLKGKGKGGLNGAPDAKKGRAATTDDAYSKLTDARIDGLRKKYDLLEKVATPDLLTAKGTEKNPSLSDMFTPVNQRFTESGNPTVRKNMDAMDGFTKALTGPDAAKNKQAVETALAVALFQISKGDPAKSAEAVIALRDVAKKLTEALANAKTDEERQQILRLALSGMVVFGPHNPGMGYAKLGELLEGYGKNLTDDKAKDAFAGLVDDVEAWGKAQMRALQVAGRGKDKADINMQEVYDTARAEHNDWLTIRLIENGVPKDRIEQTIALLCKCEGCEIGKK